MVFSVENLAKPTKSGYELAKWMQEHISEEMDSQEMWILENYSKEGDNDD